jgi:hypothetical protein
MNAIVYLLCAIPKLPKHYTYVYAHSITSQIIASVINFIQFYESQIPESLDAHYNERLTFDGVYLMIAESGFPAKLTSYQLPTIIFYASKFSRQKQSSSWPDTHWGRQLMASFEGLGRHTRPAYSLSSMDYALI